MKILIINYYYPPVGRAHSFRWQELSQYWAEQGHDVSFVTSRFVEERFNEKVNLIEVGRKVSKNRFNVSTIKVDQPSIKARLKYLLKILYRKLYWPDGLWYWIFPLFFKLFQIRKQQYDYVVTYSPTFVSHLGGLFFKKISKKEIFWIADYGDPFSISETMQPNNFKLYRKLNYFFENKVLVNADKTVFTNAMTLNAYKERFKSLSSEIIPHTVDIDKFYASDKKINLKNVRIVYVGSFHKGIREPYKATKFIQDLIQVAKEHDVYLHFDVYGPTNGLDVSGLESSSIKFYGSIERKEAIEKIKSADLLVNIENQNCVMSPSKIVEYLATGKPVLNIIENSPSSILSNKPQVVNVNLNSVNLKELFASMYSVLNSATLTKKEVEENISDYRIGNISKKYLSLFK